jgi:hypothetical protein
MPIWTFVDYVEGSGRNPFAEWMRREIPPEAAVAINGRFTLMRGMERWPDKWVSDYQGYVGLLEARIPYDKVQYRPLFMYSVVVRRQVVLLSGAIERNRKIRRALLDAASDRREILLKEPGRVERHRFG